jgi:predicted adenylyl cyclase CyaB
VSANLEIKAPVADPAAFRARAAALATETVGVDDQVDTYFRVPRGRLKLRESSLAGGQLVPYLRPDADGPRRADYQVIPVADPAGLKALLTAMLGVHCVVRKRREIWLADHVRIHLDAVEGLGDFMELEAVFDGRAESEPAEHEKVARLMKALGVEPSELVAGSYETLLAGAPRR